MERPTPTQLAGTYRLTNASREYLLKVKRYPTLPDSSVEIQGDGTIRIHDLPDCADDGLGESRGQFRSGHGTWELKEVFPGYGLDLRIEKGGTLRSEYYGGPWIHLRQASPPHTLEFTVGDPDSGEVLRYAKGAP